MRIPNKRAVQPPSIGTALPVIEAVPSEHLLNKFEINSLLGSVDRKGYTLVPLKLYWKRGNVKLEIGLGKGKQLHDKRHTLKEKDWSRQKDRMMKNINL